MAFFSILLVMQLLVVALAVATAIDASRYPEWAFLRTGTTRMLWIVLPLVFIFFCGLGAIVMGIVWFSSKKVQVEREASVPPGLGMNIGMYPPPPPGWGPPPPPGWAPPPPQDAPPPWNAPPPPPPPPGSWGAAPPSWGTPPADAVPPRDDVPPEPPPSPEQPPTDQQ